MARGEDERSWVRLLLLVEMKNKEANGLGNALQFERLSVVKTVRSVLPQVERMNSPVTTSPAALSSSSIARFAMRAGRLIPAPAGTFEHHNDRTLLLP